MATRWSNILLEAFKLHALVPSVPASPTGFLKDLSFIDLAFGFSNSGLVLRCFSFGNLMHEVVVLALHVMKLISVSVSSSYLRLK